MKIVEMTKPGAVRVIRSSFVEEVIPGLNLPGFEFQHRDGPTALGEALFEFLKNKTQEEVWVFYLLNGTISAVSHLGLGTYFTVGFDHRAVVRQALELNATEVVVAHCHTLPGLVPSDNDARATKHLAELLGGFEVALLDHFIIGAEGWVKMLDTFPYCTNPDSKVDALQQLGAPGAGMAGMPGMPGAMPNAKDLQTILSDILAGVGPIGSLPKGMAPDPRFPPINMAINISTEETIEKDVVRMIAELKEALEFIKSERASGRLANAGAEDSGLVVTGHQTKGPILIADDCDIEALVREVIVPLMKNEEPKVPIPRPPKLGGQPPEAESLADQLKGLDDN